MSKMRENNCVAIIQTREEAMSEQKLLLAGVIWGMRCERDVEVVVDCLRSTGISSGFDEILAIIAVKEKQTPSSYWSELKQFVNAQRAEKQKQQAEQVTDADKALSASLVLTKASRFFPSGYVGEKALIMGRVVLNLQKIMGRVIRAKTKNDLVEAEKELMKVPNGV
jgi:hypothetical protein